MKKTIKRQSKTLNSKSKKRTMKGGKPFGEPVMKQVGGPVMKQVGGPDPRKLLGSEAGHTKNPYGKHTNSPIISKLKQNIAQRENIMHGETGLDKKIEQVRQKLGDPKLSYTGKINMFKQLESLKARHNLQKEEANKGTPLEVMKAELAKLQRKHEKNLAKMAEKKKSEARAKQIIAQTLRLWKS